MKKKAIRSIFIGYNGQKKGWRCVDPTTNKIKANVLFLGHWICKGVIQMDQEKIRWAGPFHQIFEKGPNLLLDGQHGDRLQFNESQPLQRLND